jgi:hypothetical protein
MRIGYSLTDLVLTSHAGLAAPTCVPPPPACSGTWRQSRPALAPSLKRVRAEDLASTAGEMLPTIGGTMSSGLADSGAVVVLTAPSEDWLRRIRAAAPRWLMWSSVGLAVLFWLIEAGIHAWLLHENTYRENLLPRDPDELWMNLLVVALILGNGALSAALVRNLTRTEQRHGQLQQELQGALLRHLSGIVPICMHCKSVRDSGEQWSSIENYLASRTDLRFSHGICASCFAKHHSV